MAIAITAEGGDGVGKTTLALMFMEALGCLGAGEVESYSRYLAWYRDRKPSILLDPYQYYRNAIATNPEGLYFIHITEPAKEGIEAESRNVFLEADFARLLGALAWIYGYSYSRAVTYATLFQACSVIKNLVIIADRCGLTTETMQPADFLKEALKDLALLLDIKEERLDLMEIVRRALREIETSKREAIISHLIKLAVIDEVQQEIRGSLGNGLPEKIIRQGAEWFKREVGYLRFIREDIQRRVLENYGVIYPEIFVIADVSDPYRIGRARNLARYLNGGILNFRDLEPLWVVNMIAERYRTVPRTFPGAIARYLNTYCPFEEMRRMAMLALGEIIFDREDPVRGYLEKLGIGSPEALVPYVEGRRRREAEMHLRPVRDFDDRAVEVAAEIGVSLERVMSLKHLGRGGVPGLSDQLSLMMGMPYWTEAREHMREIWGRHRISSEGIFLPLGCEGVQGGSVEAGM